LTTPPGDGTLGAQETRRCAVSERDELSIAFEQDGKELVRELEREVLTTGAWATVMYLYQERSRNAEEWSEPKVRIQRFQKKSGEYKYQSKFNISSAKQAEKIIEVLGRWYKLGE
jgi:hypothetical protein